MLVVSGKKKLSSQMIDGTPRCGCFEHEMPEIVVIDDSGVY